MGTRIAPWIDGQAMIKAPRAAIEMGTHHVARAVTGDTIGCLAITRGLDLGCAILDRTWHLFLFPLFPSRKWGKCEFQPANFLKAENGI